ncbi:MAG: sigma 54-interacting transcriptional regulator [Pseudomonadota bacterium]
MIRRMWRVEVEFADESGRILSLERRIRVTGLQSLCHNSLLDGEGGRQCDKAARDVVLKIRRGAQTEAALYDDCHLGLKYLGVPVWNEGRFIGAILSGGFLTEPPDEKTKTTLLAKSAAFHGTAPAEPASALAEIPLLSEAQVQALKEVIQFGLDEVMRYHTEAGVRAAAFRLVPDIRGSRFASGLIVGQSMAMQNLFVLMEKLKDSNSTVLIQGENGTGKELVAKAIHFSSRRKDKPFLSQNCSALNDNLLDSELFGHVRGSFTGAVRDKKGLFETADSGTFFMDEVGVMSPALQVKLLRVLQEGMFIPVGGTEPRYVDVRIVAATNQNLKQMVDESRFREDLYYRLNVINLVVPALRDRREDVPLLVEHFQEKYSRPEVPRKIFSPQALDALIAYNWPGNVRQLENEIQRAMVLSGRSAVIERDVLSPAVTMAAAGSFQVKFSGKLRDAMEHVERQILLEGLRRYSWNKSRLSKELGISRATLIWKIQKYGLSPTNRT